MSYVSSLVCLVLFCRCVFNFDLRKGITDFKIRFKLTLVPYIKYHIYINLIHDPLQIKYS